MSSNTPPNVYREPAVIEDAQRLAERVAAALGWDGHGAPRILATAHGVDALTLLDKAREAGIPLHEDRELAALLAQIPVQTEIPPELYRVVAEVLAWIFAASGVDPRDRLPTPARPPSSTPMPAETTTAGATLGATSNTSPVALPTATTPGPSSRDP